MIISTLFCPKMCSSHKYADGHHSDSFRLSNSLPQVLFRSQYQQSRLLAHASVTHLEDKRKREMNASGIVRGRTICTFCNSQGSARYSFTKTIITATECKMVIDQVERPPLSPLIRKPSALLHTHILCDRPGCQSKQSRPSIAPCKGTAQIRNDDHVKSRARRLEDDGHQPLLAGQPFVGVLCTAQQHASSHTLAHRSARAAVHLPFVTRQGW
ncbi:hypothetical protein IE81DRAFT_73536 [Ceraceosorus guamensis]|uniref:Uncharacterized protein n=1 Tax=Ceraceosorus guamensis TaxID=1522189 RepID=A0A316W3H5_9BASI|nr:hypothetical protein IE81DRAFT_73536 [Ceraceosorus guamensis]PWN43658.1 hypothetical protein IE81DRAFT_73536 [Ceraceosorus guamensis]